MLLLADNQITGDILGKPIFGKTVPATLDGSLPRGLFDLKAPEHDPVFGAFVLAVRQVGGAVAIAHADEKRPTGVGSGGGAVAYGFEKVRPIGVEIDKKPMSTSRFVEWKRPLQANFGDHIGPGTAESIKMQTPLQSPDGAPSAFVISQRAIPGRHCLVIVAGYSDLLDALKASGGAELMVR